MPGGSDVADRDRGSGPSSEASSHGSDRGSGPGPAANSRGRDRGSGRSYDANADGRARRIRLSDVAQRANVSTSTASRALNGIGELSPDTRAAVKQAARELNFRPSPVARSLRTRRSHTVGLVVPTVAHAFYAAVTTGAQAVLEEQGYRLILVDSGEDPQTVTRAVQTLLDHEVDGLLVSTAPFGAEHFNELLNETPCVFIDELAPGAGAANVVLENVRGVKLLVDHIVTHGHERIAFLGGPKDRTSGYERLEGFVSAMSRHGLEARNELIRECEWTIASGFEQTVEILKHAPTALVTSSGELGLGALAAARKARIEIPGALALVCFDDLYFSPLLEPSLTAISYDARSIGREGARLLLDAAREEQSGQSDVRIDVSLVVRRSCGCAYDPAADLVEVLG